MVEKMIFPKFQGLAAKALGHLPVVVMLAGSLAGCATGLSQQECQIADWHTIGFEDGAKGRPEAQLGKHRKACAEHGIALQFEEYRAGWHAGVKSYCQPANGYNLGRKGRTYGGVCPATLEPEFLGAYRNGRSVYTLEQDVSRLNRSLTRKRNRLKAIDTATRDASLELVANGVPTERRIILIDNIRKLAEERAETKTRIPVIQAELENKRQQLETLSSARIY